MKNKEYYNRKTWARLKLTLSMSALVFSLICVSFSSVFCVYHIVCAVPFLDVEMLPRHSQLYLFAFISLILGIVLAVVFRHIIIIPLHNSYMALGRISDGDFDVRVDVKGIKAVKNVARSINKMSKELDGIETMRNDFINNFSHEFKTPIVSIKGFAKMLKDENLTEEEKKEYLDIIISESERLSQLATNVLNLSRLDNQAILPHVAQFNVTEQIRLVVVLLEQKWAKKNITVNLEGDDYIISASEETLQQLWINLLDNAVKYSPENSEITIRIKKKGKNIVFTFTDSGRGMTEDEVQHAFDRFYQGDMEHKSSGNGIGLSVAKKVCELHGGSITIKSTDENGTTFEVILPEEQE